MASFAMKMDYNQIIISQTVKGWNEIYRWENILEFYDNENASLICFEEQNNLHKPIIFNKAQCRPSAAVAVSSHLFDGIYSRHQTKQ